jgi:hypothetical protein
MSLNLNLRLNLRHQLREIMAAKTVLPSETIIKSKIDNSAKGGEHGRGKAKALVPRPSWRELGRPDLVHRLAVYHRLR